MADTVRAMSVGDFANFLCEDEYFDEDLVAIMKKSHFPEAL